MVTNEEKLAARAFYSALFEQFIGEMFSMLDTHEFLNSQSVGYLKLGDERGYLYPGDNFEDYIELKRVNLDSAPQRVIDSFERHVWYSQHNLSDINVFKYDVAGQETFAIYISGYVDDGWDNGCRLLEVYNAEGKLLGATTNGKDWKEQQLDHQDYFQFTPTFGSQSEPMWLQQDIRET